MSFAIPLSRASHPEVASSAAATTNPPATSLSHHFPALDGVRGVAILLVLLLHFSTMLAETGWENSIRKLCIPGYLGVTLFFVLSGFLITRILVQTRDTHGYFQTFYIRRSLRIFPLYFAYISTILLLYYPMVQWRSGESYHLGADSLYYFFYLGNRTVDLAEFRHLGHLWSLAIEEQFYMVWPFVVFLLPRRWLLPACLIGFVASFACRMGLAMIHTETRAIYVLTVSRMDALLIGAAAGIIELNQVARQRMIRALRPTLLVGLAGMAFFGYRCWFRMEHRSMNTLGWSVCAVFFATVVFWAATTGASNRFLNARWLRTLGKYCYGIYMLHVFPMMFIGENLPQQTLAQRLGSMLLVVAATALLTIISWKVIEQPFLRLKKRAAYVTA